MPLDLPRQESGKGPGPGHRLWRGVVTLGANSSDSEPPVSDGKWLNDTWLEADLWSAAAAGDYDMVGATVLDQMLTDGIVDQESMLLLPTLGYHYILVEALFTSVAGIGFLWRPVAFENVLRTF